MRRKRRKRRKRRRRKGEGEQLKWRKRAVYVCLLLLCEAVEEFEGENVTVRV